MSTPEGKATAPKSAHPHAVNILSRKPLTTGRAAWIIACVTVLMTIISGVLIHLTDKKNYPGIGDGLWWAILTVITSVITSTFIESGRRRLQVTSTDTVSAKLDQIGTRLDAIEATLKNISGHRDDAPR